MSSPKTLDVLGVGCNSVDYDYRLPAAPRADSPTAKMRISSHTVSYGGQTATAVAACAALGLRAGYLGAVGGDDNGRRLCAELERRGVDISHVLTRSGPNRFAVIAVDNQTGERIVLWDRDERLSLRPREIAPEVLGSARLIHVDDEDQEAATTAARVAQSVGVQVTSDIDRLTERTEELVAAVSIPIFAEHVPLTLTGRKDPESALRHLRRKHDGLLCVTLGHQGALALDGDRAIHVPAFRINAVDTTGAGDVFRGGFIYGYLQGWSTEQVLRFANAAAAVSSTRLGALTGVPELTEVETMLAESQSTATP